MVIIVGNGITDPSSNPTQSCLNFNSFKAKKEIFKLLKYWQWNKYGKIDLYFSSVLPS